MKKSVPVERRITQGRRLKKGAFEPQPDRIARDANERFIKSGIKVRDVYGKLAE
ncbi:MAG: hypothetical protein ABSF71_24615 [Terriglobia bacterium]